MTMDGNFGLQKLNNRDLITRSVKTSHCGDIEDNSLLGYVSYMVRGDST